MKIVVQDEFIDTESIYRIGKIYSRGYGNYNQYCFDIEHYDHTCKTVMIDNINIEKQMEFNAFVKDLGKKYDEYSIDETSKKLKLHGDIFLVNKERLEKMRLDIVKIWSENQSTIPKFEIENY